MTLLSLVHRFLLTAIRMIDEKKLQCLVCNRLVANTSNVLSRHLRTAHDIEWANYVVTYEHGGEWPTCACGCGEKLVWKKGGFGKYSKGHDNQGPQNSQANISFDGPGWIVNPFTAQEEHISLDDEVALLEHCFKQNDPVTHEHGIRVGWEDAQGKVRIVVPSFKHLQKRLILTVDNAQSSGFDARVAGFKAWCDTHSYMLLVLEKNDEGFTVIAAHRGKEIKNASEKQ